MATKAILDRSLPICAMLSETLPASHFLEQLCCHAMHPSHSLADSITTSRDAHAKAQICFFQLLFVEFISTPPISL